MVIGDWMGRGATYWSDRTAVVDVAKGSHGRFTYRQMNDRATALAAFFASKGVGAGDRVGLLAHNGVEQLDALFAAAKLGAVLVPFSWRLPAAELAPLFRRFSPKALLYSDEFSPAVAQLKASGVELPTLVHLEGAGVSGSVAYEAALSSGAPAAPLNEGVNPEDTVCLLFTGGTTGLPKAAKLSYRMLAWNTLNGLIHELLPGDVTLTHTPMFHTGGLFVYTLPLLTVGGTVVLMRRWDADAALELMQREKVTAFFAVPTQYQQLLASPRFAKADLKALRYVTSGGAPLPVPVIEAWQKVHPVPFKQGFGMTEFGPGVFSMGPEHATSKAGSIGRPNYFVEAKLIDEQGREVPPGEVGEICLKGPSMFSGYEGDADQTRAAIDERGWFHTGDLARRDADGFYFIVDRKKDMFISGGENVYPVEIEKVLYQHPSVHQCAVIGVPDATWGEVGRAFVVLKPGAAATPEALLAHVQGQLARFKVPKSVQLLSSLPTSPAGKILKRELRGGDR